MKKGTIILLTLFCVQFLSAYNGNVDSLKTELKKSGADSHKISLLGHIGQLYEEAGNDSAIYYLTLSQELSEKSKNKQFIAISEANFGCFYLKKSVYDTALTHHIKALQLFVELNDSVNIAEQHAHLSEIYHNIGRFKRALEHNLLAVEIYDKLRISDKSVTLRSNLSDIYMRLGNSKKALECLNDVLNYQPRQKVESNISPTYVNIGYIHYQLGDFDAALRNYRMALEYAKKLDDKSDIALSYALIGKSLMRLEQFEGAEQNMMLALNLFRELDDKFYLNKVNINLTELYNDLGLHDKAAHFAEEAIQVSHELNVLWMENLAQYELSVAHYERGLYKEAYLAHLKHKNVNDKITQQIRTKEIADIHIKYESEKKEKENDELRKSNALQKLALFRQKKVSGVLILILFVAVLLSLFILNRYLIKRQINKQLIEKNRLIQKQQEELSEALNQLKDSNEELEQQKEEIKTQAEILEEANATKDKFFSIIAHDLKSPFNSILGLSEIMLRNLTDLSLEKLKSYIQAINKASNTTYDLLNNLLVWARSQSQRIEINREELNLYELINQCIMPHMHHAEIKNIRVDNTISNEAVVVVDKYTISTVLGNVFSNAIKFTPHGGDISLHAQPVGEYIHVKIKDSGIGIPKDNIDKLFKVSESFSTSGTDNESGTGLGLILCKDFVEKNEGSIYVESKEGVGTTFTITIPAHNKSNTG